MKVEGVKTDCRGEKEVEEWWWLCRHEDDEKKTMVGAQM